MQALESSDCDDIIFQAPFVCFEREGLVHGFEQLRDGLLLLGVGDGPEGGDGGEFVALDAQAEAHVGRVCEVFSSIVDSDGSSLVQCIVDVQKWWQSQSKADGKKFKFMHVKERK